MQKKNKSFDFKISNFWSSFTMFQSVTFQKKNKKKIYKYKMDVNSYDFLNLISL